MQTKIRLLRIVAILCSIVLLLSVFMTGTYAWQNTQQVMNLSAGKAAKTFPVELIKLEKTLDGTKTDKTIEGAVFYLYRDDGTQIGAAYKTDENGKINVNVRAGNYYFEEVSPGVGYTYDIDENGEPIKNYKFTVVEDTENTTVTAYNIRTEGSLLITKTVQNSDNSPLDVTQKNTSFEFKVTFSDNGSYGYKIDNGEEKILKSGETLQLTNGQTAIFGKIPAGVVYNVTETPMAGYTISSSGHRGNIVEGQQAQAVFVNVYKKTEFGTIVIEKKVKGEDADYDKEFSFVAIINGESENFTLKPGRKKTITGIPIGSEYTVSEVEDPANADYIATSYMYTGIVADTETINLIFVNVHQQDPIQGVGNLTVEKKVTGENIDPNKEFSFKVIYGEEGSETEVPFTLKADQNKTIINIPAGSKYTVMETDAAGYIPVIQNATGTIAPNETTVISFRNKAPAEVWDTVKLTVKKILQGEVLASDMERYFDMTLTVDGKETPFRLKANEIIEFDIPVGAIYDIREEDYIKEGFSQYISNGSGTAVDKFTEVVVTNTYVAEPLVELHGEKTWKLEGETNVKLPEFIVLSLKNGDKLVEEKIVKPNGNKKWLYTFVVPKYNPDGSTASYTIEEKEVTSFKASYDGFNITNTYVKPTQVELPVITKVVKGENAPNTLFEFVFEGQKGAPMPEGSDGTKKHLQLNGAGQLEVGRISCTRVGTYTYTIREVNGEAENWSYDDSLYTFTVVVTEEKGGLVAKTALEKNTQKADKVVFTNSFKVEDKDTVMVSGIKTWEHGTNPESQRPDSIVVKVYGDGELKAQRKVTADDKWCYSFEMPKYASDGHEITYVVDEETVRGYYKMISGYDIVNRYVGIPDVPGGTDADAPTTGDQSQMPIWISVMCISFLGMIVSIFFERKFTRMIEAKKR